MAETENVMLEILKQYQKKSGAILEIYRLTQEMDQMLSANDHGSTQLILEMRQEEMDRASECNHNIAYLEDHLTEEDRERFQRIIHGPEGEEAAQNWEEKKLWEISNQVELLLKKTIQLDQRLNMRISGNDSFYNQKK